MNMTWWSIKFKLGCRWPVLEKFFDWLHLRKLRKLRKLSDKELKRAAKNSYKFKDDFAKGKKLTLRCLGEGKMGCPQLNDASPSAEVLSHLLETGKLVLDSTFDKKVVQVICKTPPEETWTQLSKKASTIDNITKEEWEANRAKDIEDFRRLCEEVDN